VYDQLDLEVVCKKPSKKKCHISFINFGTNKFTVKKYLAKKL
jgi:hypothetical protein